MKKFKILLPILFLGILLSLGMFNSASAKQTYDISQFQGNITNGQAHNLKHEVNFTILRAQYGSEYQDPEFSHDAYEMSAHHIPYGAYDYSLYSNGQQARSEADILYRRAPQARFYVNDSEENRAGKDLNQATYDWASEIHRLTTKPAVLYSDESFMNRFNSHTRHHYNTIWLASYGRYQPSPGYHYDLWQYTDNHYSRALGKKLDASVFPRGWIKPLSFWTRNHKNHRKRTHVVTVKSIRRHNVNAHVNAIHAHRHHVPNSFSVSINGSDVKLLKSYYRTGNHHRARKSGFQRGLILNGFHTIFDRYYPNSRKAVIPRKYHIIPNNTIWIVHSYTNDMNIINHIRYVYYYNGQYHGWIKISL